MSTSNVVPSSSEACRRCGEKATIKGRNEPLCRSCFLSYVDTKIVKRLEHFRVKNAHPSNPTILLVPLSLGISSIILLHALDARLKRQNERTGRTGFEVRVLHVRLPNEDGTQTERLWETIKSAYPDHQYFSLSLLDEPLPPQGPSEKLESGHGKRDEWTQDLLQALPTVTSRVDVLQICLVRFVVQFALNASCSGVLFGCSTTTLAERILAETAKGRGSSLSWQVMDGPSPWGIPFNYPLRDLLKKELAVYAELMDFDRYALVKSTVDARDPVASKDGSIDVLMRGYFATVEEQYPSIVANVVRTVGKLEVMDDAATKRCRLCMMPAELASSSESVAMCYGCARAVPPDCRHLLPDG